MPDPSSRAKKTEDRRPDAKRISGTQKKLADIGKLLETVKQELAEIAAEKARAKK
jgi:uncharacterized FlgJ-related protein